MPGDEEDKTALFQVPYQNMVKFMFEQPNEQAFSMLYDRLKNQGSLMFLTTSFLRGITLDNAIIIVDEAQNLTFHELDTIITRVGMDSKIMFCGDFDQTDLQRTNEKNGLHDFLRILEEMDEFNCTEFTIGDIVRSGFIRSYLINKIKLGAFESTPEFIKLKDKTISIADAWGNGTLIDDEIELAKAEVRNLQRAKINLSKSGLNEDELKLMYTELDTAIAKIEKNITKSGGKLEKVRERATKQYEKSQNK